MTRHPLLWRLAAAAALAPLTLGTVANAQYVLNLREADIRAYVQEAARVTGRTMILDGRVQGKVTVVSDRPLSRSEYFEIFLSTLRSNGLVAIPTANGAYRIQPSDTAASQPSPVGRATSRNAFVTEVIRLQSADAVALVETLRPLVSKDGSITANKAGNSLVIVDYADNIPRIRDVLRRLDRDTSASRIVYLKNAGAREVAEALTGLAGQDGVAVSPVDSANAVALRGEAGEVARFAAIAAELDGRAASGTEIRVYRLEHADAAALLPVLQTLVGQTPSQPVPAQRSPSSTTSSSRPGLFRDTGNNSSPSSAPLAAPVSSGPASPAGTNPLTGRGTAVVTRAEGVNAIIIAANPDLQRMLGETIRQLDERKPQVLVEAIIVEIGDNAAKRLGVQFLLAPLTRNGAPFLSTNYTNANPNILTVAGAVGATLLDRSSTTVNGNIVTTGTSSPITSTLQQAAATSILQATGALAGFATTLGSTAVLGAIINAVNSDDQSNLLSVPSIITHDGITANFLVGQEIPITTGEALSNNFDNAFRTTQREEVGIKLQVTPQVNSSGEVRLTIRQEVSSIAGAVGTDSTGIILNKRAFDTTLTVDDGDIAAIGGLLDDNERFTLQKIPLLGDLPLIGALFRSKSKTRNKTNLVVFIRPTILRSREDTAAIAARRWNGARRVQLARRPDEEPALDELARDYLDTVPPGGFATVLPTDVVIDGYDAGGRPLPPGTVVNVPVAPSADTASDPNFLPSDPGRPRP